MSAVVLRCPNCGTTRATPGECEACHAAQVRYFCTNHTPGRWLEAPACPQCGARFDEPDRAATAPKPTPISGSAPPIPAAPRRAPRPPLASSSTAAPTSPTRRPTASEEGDATPGRERWPPGDEASSPRHGLPTRMPMWQAFLLAATRARRMPAKARPELAAVPVARGLGCLVRFILIMVVLFFALVSAVFLFGGSLLRMFLPY